MKLPMYIRALELAQEIHKSQVRQKNNEPYINHPIRVSQQFEDDLRRTVALLHDGPEDHPEYWPIIKNEFPYEIVDALELLTHDEKDNYFDYIMKLAQSKNAAVIQIKIKDIEDNLRDVKEGSKADKYRFALYILENAL